MEIAAHRFAQPLHTHAVVEQTVEDRLADPIAVFRRGSIPSIRDRKVLRHGNGRGILRR